jgi:hypothetical protein
MANHRIKLIPAVWSAQTSNQLRRGRFLEAKSVLPNPHQLSLWGHPEPVEAPAQGLAAPLLGRVVGSEPEDGRAEHGAEPAP